MANVGLQFRVSLRGQCLYLVFSRAGSATGAPATHNDDILGYGEQGFASKTRNFLERRFGKLKVQKSPCVHVGMGLSREDDFSEKLTKVKFTPNSKPRLTSPKLRAARQQLLSPGGIKLRQCKLGEH